MLKIKARHAKKLLKFISIAVMLRDYIKPWLISCFGLRTVLRSHLSDFTPSPFCIILPGRTFKVLNFILLARGITHNNKLLHFFASKALIESSKFITSSNPTLCPKPLPEWLYWVNSIEELRHDYIHKERPVVIKNFPHEAKYWNLDFFIKKYGDRKIVFTDPSGKNFEAPLKLIEETKNSDSKFYVHNCARILHHEDFNSGLNLGEMKKHLNPWQCREVFNLFLGSFQSSGSPFHCAPSCNAFYQIEGEKLWTLVDPNYTQLLYPVVTSQNEFQGSSLPFPLKEEDYKDFPLIFHCPRYSVKLGPGDILLVPRWWYHSVENLSTVSVGVATRWENTICHNDTNHLYSLLLNNKRSFLANAKKLNELNYVAKILDRSYMREVNNLVYDEISHDSYHSHISDLALKAWSIETGD